MITKSLKKKIEQSLPDLVNILLESALAGNVEASVALLNLVSDSASINNAVSKPRRKTQEQVLAEARQVLDDEDFQKFKASQERIERESFLLLS